LDLFYRGGFDLVITDYSMPLMSGNELARRIKDAAPKQPILMITAHAEQSRSPANPVDAIINKPFTIGELRETMARLVGVEPASRAG
jgi:CheY-like chemotaxis protein